ncbi:MAG: hypothetical protein GY798_17400 [Hyphomicrobiales bacterium]|nr:hypothetical protein [Hyphomicrobiales bacterium]
MEFFNDHGYLLSTLVGIPGVLIALAVAGQYRLSVLIAGLIETLHAPPLVWFDGVYWSPQRIGDLAVGVEDVLVCFSLGAGAWFASILPFRSRLIIVGRWRDSIARLIAVSAGGALLGLLVWLAGAGVMAVLLIVMFVMTVVLGGLRPHLLQLSLAAVILYPVYYAGVLWITAGLVPGFFGIWDGPELWGPRLLGLPVEELAFVAMFSISYPLIIGTVLDVRLPSRRSGASRVDTFQ